MRSNRSRSFKNKKKQKTKNKTKKEKKLKKQNDSNFFVDVQMKRNSRCISISFFFEVFIFLTFIICNGHLRDIRH